MRIAFSQSFQVLRCEIHREFIVINCSFMALTIVRFIAASLVVLAMVPSVAAEPFQQSTVVAPDVDRQVVVTQAVPFNDNIAQLIEMGAKGIGGGRHVQIIGEHVFRRHYVDQLDVAASVAKSHP